MRSFKGAALILLGLHVLAGLGGLVYAAQHGAFAPQRLKAAADALRGRSDPADAPASQPATLPTEAAVATSRPAVDGVADEIRRIELDRREREIADQWALIRAAQLQLLRDRESLDAARKEAATVATVRENPAGGEGYKKQLEYLQSVKPKQAKDLLRQQKDADAVEILMSIEPRVGRKIIDACKTAEERLWMGRLLEQLRQRNDVRAELLAASAS